MVTVADVIKAIDDANDPGYLPLKLQLERFSPGTPIKGAAEPEGTLTQVSFTAGTAARLEDGEVILE